MSEVITQSAWPTGTGRKGWIPAEFDREAASVTLHSREVDALEEVLDRVKRSGVPLGSLGAAELAHPVLDAFLLPLAEQLRWGPGLVFLRGIPVEGRDVDHVRVFYRAIGQRFGNPVSQNWRGEQMVDVAAVGGAASGRAYASSGALPLHTDRIDILSLLVVRNAIEGGASIFGSSLHIWETVERERPDVLPILRRGFRQFRNGEQADGDPTVTPYPVPAFAEVDGLRSCLISGNVSPMTIRSKTDQSLSDEESEALEWFKALLARPDMRITATMRPGEAVFINNYEVLHGREAFEDTGGPDGRLLIRLWLEGVPPRPRPPEQTVTKNRSGHQGIDPRDGPPMLG
jgi:hypothetical protein